MNTMTRHPAFVRVTHWISTLCFLALLVSGIQIVISHPRFYWGETGNVMEAPLFSLPIPASRESVPTGYGYVLPDQNGWSRSLHFQSAWFVLFTGLFYASTGGARRLWQATFYQAWQRRAYLAVIFFLFPFMFWSGLAMSPGFTAAVPATVNSLGGQQSARTLHFLATLALAAFTAGHVFMVWRAGFVKKTRGMITGKESA